LKEENMQLILHMCLLTRSQCKDTRDPYSRNHDAKIFAPAPSDVLLKTLSILTFPVLMAKSNAFPSLPDPKTAPFRISYSRVFH
jgi:hypothetical protein